MKLPIRHEVLFPFILLVFLLLPAASSRTAAATFDFEGLPATSPPGSGALTTLSLTSSGLTMLLSRQGGVAFDIFDNTAFPGPPASWGARSLAPFFDTSASAFVANFTSPVTGFSLEFGDYGVDSDTITLNAYLGPDGTGPLLGSTTVSYGLNAFPTIGVASLSGLAGAQSVIFIGGSSAGPNSLFYDNIQVSIPEPGTSVLVAVGLTCLVGFRRTMARVIASSRVKEAT